MNNLIRNVLSIMAGTFVAIFLIALVQAVAHQMYPPPADFDYEDAEALSRLMMEAPLGALVMVLVSYAVGTMAGAFVAGRFAAPEGASRQGLFVMALMLIAAFMNLNAIPHPVWFWFGSIGVIVVFGFLGAQVGGRRECRANQ